MIFITLFLFTNYQIGLVLNAVIRQGDGRAVCDSEECYEAAISILKWLEHKENPCNDFYEFACGHWRNTPQDERINSSLGMRGDIANFYLKDILEDPHTVMESNIFKTLKNFLSVCLDEKDIEARGASPLLPLLKKVGGWPVLEDDWSEEEWDFIDTEVLFGGVLIAISLAPDYNNHYETYFIQIGKPSSSLSEEDSFEGLKNKEVQNYFDQIVNVAEDLGANRTVAGNDLKEILDMDIALAEELNEKPDSETLYTLNELQEDISWLNWTRLLEETFPDSVKIRPDEKISVENPQYLKTLGKFIVQYSKENVVNFILSKAVFALLPYLSPKLSNRTVTKKEMSENCVETASRSSLSLAAASYLAIKTKQESDFARTMVQNLKEELLKEVEEIQWFDEETRQSVLQNLTNLKLKVGFPPEILNISKVNEFYEGFQINTSHSFEAKFDNHRWMRRFQYGRLRKRYNDIDVATKAAESFGLDAHYDPEENEIVLSAPMLHHIPLTSSKIPLYISYGQLGTVIAHELIHALDLNANPVTSGEMQEDDEENNDIKEGKEEQDGNKDLRNLLFKKWAINDTEQIYIQKRQCFIDQYSAFNDTKITNLKLNGAKTKREDMADNGGLKLALRGYRKQTQGQNEDNLLLLEQYTPEQLFMISAAMAFCYIPYMEDTVSSLDSDTHSLKEFRIKGMAMNSPDFGKAFDCAEGDPMNPIEKCEVWRPM